MSGKEFRSLDSVSGENPGAESNLIPGMESPEATGVESTSVDESAKKRGRKPRETESAPEVAPESVLVQELVRALQTLTQSKPEVPDNTSLLTGIRDILRETTSKNTTEDTVLSHDVVAAQYTPDDVLEEPIMFFRQCGGTWVDLGGPAADGSYHLPPFRDRYNKVVPMIWGKGPEIHTGFGIKGERLVQRFAQYICKSKKELEYIRKHRDFGTLILEKTINTAFTTNNFINALSNASRKVAHMSQVDRVMFAKDRGIDTDADASKWYNELVINLAQEEVRTSNIQLSQANTMFESLKNGLEHQGSNGKTFAGIGPLGGHDAVLQIHRVVNQ